MNRRFSFILPMCVQTYANLVSVYMEDDVNTELAELEEFRKQLEPTSMANQSKLRTMQTDLQVGELLHMPITSPPFNVIQHLSCPGFYARKAVLFMRWTGPSKQAGEHMAGQASSSGSSNSRADRWLLNRDTGTTTSNAIAMQAARLSVVAEREQSERALQKQSRLTAASEANDRATANRDQFMRELAARLSLQELPAQGTISPNTVTA